MHVILLGSKVADYIKDHIGTRVDNAEFQTFRSFEEFLNITSMRHIECDRFLMTSEVFSNLAEDTAKSNLRALKGTLDSQYAGTFTVTLNRNFEELQLCESIFYDDSSFNICLVDKVKPGVLRDLLVMDRDALMANYKNCTYESMAAERQVSEVNNTDIMFTHAQNIVQSTGGAQPVSKEEKKSNSIFGVFGGKKGNTQEVDTSAFAQDFNNSGEGGVTPAPQASSIGTRRKPAGFGGTAQNTNDLSFDVVKPASDAFAPAPANFDVPQSAAGFDSPNGGNLSFDVANTNLTNSYSSQQNANASNKTFDVPQGGNSAMGFDMPPNNGTNNDLNFDIPNQSGNNSAGGFDIPNQTSNFGAPNQSANSGLSFDVPNQGYSMPQRSSSMQPNVSTNSSQQASSPSLATATPLMMPNMSANMFNTAAEAESRREATKLVPRDRGSSLTQAKAVAPTNPNLDFNALATQYQEETAPVKVVTKEVVREVVREVPGAAPAVNTRYQNIINGNSKGLFLVTGDRRTGITHTAISMANFFAQKVSTLYVDLDIVRHGSLFFLGLEDIVEAETAVQNGLNLAKSGQDVHRYAFRTNKFKFDSLISMPGTKHSDVDLKESLSRLVFQTNTYDVIVIDCPMENIRLAEELLYSMDVFICVDSDLCGCNNILTLLDDASGYLDKKVQMVMRGKARYLVKQTEDRNEFATNMEYLEQTFALAEEEINWARVPCVGTLNDINSVCINLQ